MEAKAGNCHPLEAPCEGIRLLLHHPLRKTVRILGVRGMLFIHGKVIVSGRTTECTADRIDRRGEADILDSKSRGCAQRVITADRVVGIYHVVRMIARRADRSEMDERITFVDASYQLAEIANVGADVVHIMSVSRGRGSINADHSMTLGE